MDSIQILVIGHIIGIVVVLPLMLIVFEGGDPYRDSEKGGKWN